MGARGVRTRLVFAMLGIFALAILAVFARTGGHDLPESPGNASQVPNAIDRPATGAVPLAQPPVDRREIEVHVTGTVVAPTGGSVPAIRVDVAVGAAGESQHRTTDEGGCFAVDLRGAVAAITVTVELADGPRVHTFERSREIAETDWQLPPIRLEGAHALVFEIELSPSVAEAIAAAGSVLQLRARLADAGREQRVAADLAGPALATRMRRVFWFASPATLWVGVGLREPLAAITSWLHKSDRRLEAAEELVRVVVTEAMVVAGTVVDHAGNPAADVVVEWSTTTPEPRLTRGRTDAAGRFLLVPPSLERGTIAARIGSSYGERLDCGPGDRPQLTIDLSACEQVRFVRDGEPIAEPFFAALGHIGRRNGTSSAMAAYRRPHRGGVALLGAETLAAGDRVFFESATTGERLLLVTQSDLTHGRPIALDLAQAIGTVDCTVGMPTTAASDLHPATFELVEARGEDGVPDRARVDYRVDLRGPATAIRGLLRLPYRYVARLPDGREAAGELDASAAGPLHLDLTEAFH